MPAGEFERGLFKMSFGLSRAKLAKEGQGVLHRIEELSASAKLLDRWCVMKHSPVTCERCLSGEPAIYWVESDVIHLRVCKACAEEARRLGLKVEPVRSAQHAA